MKTKVFQDGLEGHVRRSLDRSARREAGERLEPERIITFADPLDLIVLRKGSSNETNGGYDLTKAEKIATMMERGAP